MLIVMTRPMIQLISIMKIISNTCNTMFFVIMFCSFFANISNTCITIFFVIMFCSFLHLFLITSCFSFLLQVIEQRWRATIIGS